MHVLAVLHRDMPPWLSWQSARLLTDRSLVRAQVVAPFCFSAHSYLCKNNRSMKLCACSTQSTLSGPGLSHTPCRASSRVYTPRHASSHTFSAFWLRSSVVSVLISLISDMTLIRVQKINLIFKPCLGSGACAILGRGPGTAVPPGAAGGPQ